MSKKWNNPLNIPYSDYKKLYDSWSSIFKRIANKDGQTPTYSNCSICEEWKDFNNFYNWSVNNGWKPGLTLDKDGLLPGNKIYCPEYCRWITKSENSKEMHSRHPEVSTIFITNNPMKRKDVLEKVTGKNHHHSRKVECIETGKIYDCCRDADRELNLNEDAVARAANPNGKQQTAGGYHWRYIN